MLKLKPIFEFISEPEYQRFILGEKIGEVPIFLKTDWLAFLSDNFGVDVKYLLVRDEYNQIISIGPICSRSRLGLKFGGLPLPGTYTDDLSPVIIDNDIKSKSYKYLINTFINVLYRHYHYAEFKLPTEQSINLKDLQKTLLKRTTVSTVSTIIIDLSLAEEELWKGVKSKTRNIVRKSFKNNIIVDKVPPSKNFVKGFFPLLEKTFSKKGQKSPHDYETFLKLLTSKLSSNFDCFQASLNDEVVSAAIFLRVDSSRALFFAGASNNTGLKMGASAAIQWEAIKHYKLETKISFYDLGGLGVSSIDRFKKGFGGQEVFQEKLIISNPLIKNLVVLGKKLVRSGLLKLWRG